MSRFKLFTDQPVGLKGRFTLRELLDDTCLLDDMTCVYIKHGDRQGCGWTVKVLIDGDEPVLVLGAPGRNERGQRLRMGHLRAIGTGDERVRLLPIECPGRGAFDATRCTIDSKGRLVLS